MHPALLAVLMILSQAASVPSPVRAGADPGLSPIAELPGYFGVIPSDVVAGDMEALGLEREAGAVVREVVTDSPAAKGGLRTNDVIVRYADAPVLSAAQFRRLVRETPPGRKVRLEILRGGKSLSVEVTLGDPVIRLDQVKGGGAEFIGRMPDDREIRLVVEEEMRGARETQNRIQPGADERPPRPPDPPPAPGKPEKSTGSATAEGGSESWVEVGRPYGEFIMRLDELGKPRLGVTVAPLGRQLANFFGLDGPAGVLVTAVQEGSPAYKAGFLAGDIILSAGESPIKDASTLRLLLSAVEAGRVEFKVWREKKEIVLEPSMEKGSNEIIIHPSHPSPLRGGVRSILLRIDESQGSSI